MDAIKDAATSSTETLILYAVLLTMAAGGLLKLVWHYARKKVDSIDHKQEKIESKLEAEISDRYSINSKLHGLLDLLTRRLENSEKEIGLINKKLDNGNKRFLEQDRRMDFVANDIMKKPEFDHYCEEHKQQHEKLDTKLQRMADGISITNQEVGRISGQMQEGFSRITDLLSKKITLGEKP